MINKIYTAGGGFSTPVLQKSLVRRAVAGASLPESGSQQRADIAAFVWRYYQMAEQFYAQRRQRIADILGEPDVIRGRQTDSAGVIVRQNYPRGIAEHCAFRQFANINRGMIDGAGTELVADDMAVNVEKDRHQRQQTAVR